MMQRSSHHPRWLGALLAALLTATTWVAHAEDAPQEKEGVYTLGYEGMWYFMGGATGGGSFGSPGGGGFVGGELSVVRLKDAAWLGLYSDATWDFGHQAATFTAGPELGFALLGLDGGAGLRVGEEDDPELGAQGRVLLSLGTMALYGRYGFWPNSDAAKHVGQVGVLLKFPLLSPGGSGPSAAW